MKLGSLVKIFLIIFVVLLLSYQTILASRVFYGLIFKPAIYSTVRDCQPRSSDGTKDPNVAGEFSIETGKPTITIFDNNSKYSYLYVKHENCHYQQYLHGRLASCDQPEKIFANELEAYFAEYSLWTC